MFTLDINLPNQSYPIIIKNNLLNEIQEYLEPHVLNKKVTIITDQNVYDLYGNVLLDKLNHLGIESQYIVVEPGEVSKSIETLQTVYSKLLNFGMTKSDLLIALGGGVIGDLTGFTAATYLRGISFLQIPTSLIAQVDSSIGGKTAVNLMEGKNLIGSFYHPSAVFIDPNLLNTLEERYFSDGMAEVIKYGCIRDLDLLKKLEDCEKSALLEIMDEIVFCCCKIKKSVVENDEKDNGIRMHLNFGHTIGHAIEKAFNYKDVTHGEGVAIGMYQITRYSEQAGYTESNTTQRLKNLLLKFNLPFQIPKVNKEILINAIMSDKKSRGNHLNIIILKQIGNCFIHIIDRNDIRQLLD